MAAQTQALQQAQTEQAPQAPQSATSSGLPEHVLRMIRGEVSAEEKLKNYDQSLQRWWSEYASRKNNEEEEHVADSLLYDERCHLPRTAGPPTFITAAGPETPPLLPTTTTATNASKASPE